MLVVEEAGQMKQEKWDKMTDEEIKKWREKKPQGVKLSPMW